MPRASRFVGVIRQRGALSIIADDHGVLWVTIHGVQSLRSGESRPESPPVSNPSASNLSDLGPVDSIMIVLLLLIPG